MQPLYHSLKASELILYLIHTCILLHTHRITGYLKLKQSLEKNRAQPTAQSWVSSDVRLASSGLYPIGLETFKDRDYTTSLGNCSLLDCPTMKTFFLTTTLNFSFYLEFFILNTERLLTHSFKANSPPGETSPGPSASYKASSSSPTLPSAGLWSFFVQLHSCSTSTT